MLSRSASEYRSACAEILDAALLRPRMYYKSLDDLEATMRGHATAFQQIGAIQRDEGFSPTFAEWLYREKGASGAAAGWAYTTQELATAQRRDAEELFSELVREFLPLWLNGTWPKP